MTRSRARAGERPGVDSNALTETRFAQGESLATDGARAASAARVEWASESVRGSGGSQTCAWLFRGEQQRAGAGEETCRRERSASR